MTQSLMTKSILFAAALTLVACGGSKQCTTNTDCSAGQVCNAGVCQTGTTGGGFGTTGGGTNNTGGGTATGGGTGGGEQEQNSNGGDTCAAAVLVNAPRVNGETTGQVNNYSPVVECLGDATPGPDTVYKVSVPAGQRISVKATSNTVSPNQYDLAVYLVPSPASNCDAVDADGGSAVVCLSGSDDPRSSDAVETGTWFNSGSAAVDVLVVVDSYFGMTINNPDGGVGAASEGAFSLDISVAVPGTNGDRCETATTLVAGTPLLGQDLSMFGNDYQPLAGNTSCPGKGSNDATYKIEVPPGDVLSLTATPSAMLDVTLGLSETADVCGLTCVRGADGAGAGEAESVLWKNTATTAKTVFIVVDGNRVTTGTFDLSATITTPPGDDSCAMPQVLVSGTPLINQSVDTYSDDYNDVVDCGYQGGNDRAYTVEVPAGKRLTVDVTIDTGDLDPIINLVEAQGACATGCIAVADDGFDGDGERLVFVNESGSAQQYVVVVDDWGFAEEASTFTITATVDDPPAGDTCQTATTLTTPLTAQSTVGYTNNYSGGTGCATVGTLDGDHVFKVTVPTGERGLVTVTPALLADGGASFSPSISFVDGPAANCDLDPRVCQGNVPGAAGVRVGAYFNQTAAPKEVFAIVDSSSLTGGTFDIAFTSAAPTADDLCTTATTALVPGTPASANLNGFTLDYPTGTGCASNVLGKERVYTVTIPANRVLTFTATPTVTTAAGPNLYLNLIGTTAAVCDSSARACIGGANSVGPGAVETLTYVNAAATPVTAFIVIGDTVANTADTSFTLAAVETMLPAGETCTMPEVVAASGTQVGLSWVGFSRQYTIPSTATTCKPYGGADRVFSVTLDAGKTLTATATASMGSMADPVVNLIAGPDTNCSNPMPVCLASADDPADEAAPEVVTYANTGTAPQTVFLIVSLFSASSPGTFSLNVQITP